MNQNEREPSEPLDPLAKLHSALGRLPLELAAQTETLIQASRLEREADALRLQSRIDRLDSFFSAGQTIEEIAESGLVSTREILEASLEFKLLDGGSRGHPDKAGILAIFDAIQPEELVIVSGERGDHRVGKIKTPPTFSVQVKKVMAGGDQPIPRLYTNLVFTTETPIGVEQSEFEIMNIDGRIIAGKDNIQNQVSQATFKATYSMSYLPKVSHNGWGLLVLREDIEILNNSFGAEIDTTSLDEQIRKLGEWQNKENKIDISISRRRRQWQKQRARNRGLYRGLFR